MRPSECARVRPVDVTQVPSDLAEDRSSEVKLRVARDKIRRYYAETYEDYKEYWTGDDGHALHLGHVDTASDTHERSLVRTNERLAAIAGDLTGTSILDAGCGTAGSCVWLATTFGCHVTGINVSDDQLRVAMDFLRRTNTLRDVDLSAQDYHTMALRGESFDVVWALESCNHSIVRALVFEEFHRVLRPGGVLVAAELTVAEGHQGLSKEARRLLDAFREGWALHDLRTVRSIQRTAASAGFAEFRCFDTTRAVVKSIVRLGTVAREAQTRTEERTRAGLWTRTRVGNIHASVALEELVRRGIIRYTIYTATKPTRGGP